MDVLQQEEYLSQKKSVHSHAKPPPATTTENEETRRHLALDRFEIWFL